MHIDDIHKQVKKALRVLNKINKEITKNKNKQQRLETKRQEHEELKRLAEEARQTREDKTLNAFFHSLNQKDKAP